MRTLMLAFAVLAVVFPSSAHAQRRRMRARSAPITEKPEIGGHIGYNFDAKHMFIGVQGTVPIAPQVDFYPSLDYYTISGASEWSLNLDFKLRPPKAPRFYFGPGLNLFHAGGTHSHLNLFGGWEAATGSLRPYVEARELIGSGSSFQITGGVNLVLH